MVLAKIYFVSGGETAEYRPDLATREQIKAGLMVYQYTAVDGNYKAKVGTTVPVTSEQLDKLLENGLLKIL